MPNYFDEMKKLREHADGTLMLRIRFFCIVFLIMIGVLIYEMLKNKIGIFLALGGVAIGVGVAFLTRKMFDVHWKEQTKKVAARLDFTAVISIILYLGFALSRQWLFAHWVRASALGAFIFSTIAGVMLGRAITTLLNFHKVLANQKLE